MCTTLRWSWILAFVASSPTAARAQCFEWSDRFYASGTNGAVEAFAIHDDGNGNGPELYVSGDFTLAGGITVNRIARWDGERWAGIYGMNGAVRAMAVFDDGSGPALFVGGAFSTAGAVSAFSLAKWNGSTWSEVGGGVGGPVYAMTVFDDGSGPALFIGGGFTSAGGTPAARVAKWDGSSWSALGSGMTGGPVYSLASFDDGTGEALYAGGGFDVASGATVNRIAKWDGSSWLPLGLGMQGNGGDTAVRSMCVFDDGAGDRLFAAGTFATADGVSVAHIAKWDGAVWSPIGSGLAGPEAPHAFALATFDDGTGDALYVGGTFDDAGGVRASRLARWDGVSWGIVGAGTTAAVRALAVFDDGGGPELVAGGDFTGAGSGGGNRVIQWDGGSWRSLDMGAGLSIAGALAKTNVLCTLDDGSGEALYAGGTFTAAGPTGANHVAKWNGVSWAAFDVISMNPTAQIYAMTGFDDGTGTALYVGGQFSTAAGRNLSKWNGTDWSHLDIGVSGLVLAMAVFDDGSGPALFVGGNFTVVGGSLLPANRIAKWNGTSWAPLGTGLSDSATALAVYDDGSGPALYVGGVFNSAGGVTAKRIAKWNGSAWSSIGNVVGGPGTYGVYTLTVFDSGAGPELYAGGEFSGVGGTTAQNLARWNGSAWSTVGFGAINGVDNAVLSLAVFDPGSGPRLVVGGEFLNAGGTAMSRITQWDGTAFSALGAGANNIVTALASFEDGVDGAPDLYVGGSFTLAGGEVSSAIAEWQGCVPGTAYCFGDGIDSVVTAPCPCSNFGGAARGCANSNSALGGARLVASGATSPNTIVFMCDGIPNNTFCTFLRSNASLDTGFAFGDGIKCLNGTGIRFSSQNAGQNGNPANTVSSGAATTPAGNTRYYQLHYRNPSAGFCPPELFNISNGYRLDW